MAVPPREQAAMGNVVHVVGTAGEAEVLVALLARLGTRLGVDEVTFHKRSLPETDAPRVRALVEAGALPCAEGDVRTRLESLRIPVAHDPAAALARATVVVDSTPYALEHKDRYAQLEGLRGVVALQAPPAFGTPLIHDVNDFALVPGTDRFLRVADAGAHAMSALVMALGTAADRADCLHSARFLHLRCAADVGTAVDFLASPVLARPAEGRFGTASAADAHAVLATVGRDAAVHAAEMELNTALLDTLHFRLTLTQDVEASHALARLREHPRVAMTDKLSPSPVFAFGRDHGLMGRLFNTLVVPRPALSVAAGREVVGFAWVPAAGTVVYTALAAVLWLLDPAGASSRLGALKPSIQEEV